jgi:hypothetical protein
MMLMSKFRRYYIHRRTTPEIKDTDYVYWSPVADAKLAAIKQVLILFV